jgi:hypothetical protein
MQEIIVCGIIDPALDWYCVICSSQSKLVYSRARMSLTFMEDVADRAVVDDHDLAEIRFDLREILDVSSIARRAMISIIASREIFTFGL